MQTSAWKRNRSICRDVVVDFYRDVLVQHVREHLEATYPEDYLQRFRQSFDDELIRAQELQEQRAARGLSPAAGSQDDIDLLDGSHIRRIFEQHYDVLVPTSAGLSKKQKKEQRQALLESVSSVQKFRNALSHPGFEPPWLKATRVLDDVVGVLKIIGRDAEAAQVAQLATTLVQDSADESSQAGPRRGSTVLMVGIGLLLATLLAVGGYFASGYLRPPDSIAVPESAAVPTAPPPLFDGLVGATANELAARHSENELEPSCSVLLVGERLDLATGTQAESGEPAPGLRCASALDLGRLTLEETAALEGLEAPSRHGPTTASYRRGVLATTVLIRAALRAKLVSESDVRAAAAADAPGGAVLGAASALVTGAHQFARARSTRRPLGAVVSSNCAGIDRERLREYLISGFSLAELDREARARVAYGKCRGLYVSNERGFQGELIERAGGLAAIGLARATQKERRLDPDDPTTFSTFSQRGSLSPGAARLGVLLASSIQKLEQFWAGALALTLERGRARGVGTLVLRLADGKVVQIFGNLSGASATVERALTQSYGAAKTSSAGASVWKTADIEATLDRGLGQAITVR